MAPETVRLVIVDDHPIVRAGLRQVLEAAAGMTVVADGASGPDALRLLADCRPDVLKLLKSLGDPQGRFTPESIWTPYKDWEFGQKKAPSRRPTLLAGCIISRIDSAAEFALV